MPIDETKTCTTHTKEKERLGICCQEEKKQKEAEQQTYEHKIKTGVCIIGAIRHDRQRVKNYL